MNQSVPYTAPLLLVPAGACDSLSMPPSSEASAFESVHEAPAPTSAPTSRPWGRTNTSVRLVKESSSIARR